VANYSGVKTMDHGPPADPIPHTIQPSYTSNLERIDTAHPLARNKPDPSPAPT